MKLSEIFEELAYGELSDLSMVSDGQIKPDQQAKVVIKLNDALVTLFTKYVIKVVDTTLSTAIKQLNYVFTNDNCVKIVYIVPNLPNEEAIYKNNDQFAIQGNKITFLKAPIADSFGLSYQWKPSKLKINPTIQGFLAQEVDIDSSLVPLVRTLVASAIFTGMNGEAHKATGVALYN